MTDNESIKALECCYIQINCTGCPLVGTKQCLETASLRALDLINRQKAEIENLQKVAETQQSLAMERHFEIARLNGEIEKLRWTRYLTVRAEAIKEFAKRLVEHWPCDIEELAKEMVGEGL